MTRLLLHIYTHTRTIVKERRGDVEFCRRVKSKRRLRLASVAAARRCCSSLVSFVDGDPPAKDTRTWESVVAVALL